MSTDTPARTPPSRWDETVDIVVVGYGYAGAVAAIEAADAGASVVLMEKMPDPGGISICSGGNVRIADDAGKAFAYLKETNAGTTPDDVLQVLADGMTQVRAYFEKLVAPCGATIDGRQADGNYPLSGTETFGYVSIDSVPDYDPVSRYPYVSSYLPPLRAAGMRLFKVMEDNIASRDIGVWLDTEAVRLIADADGEVQGLAYRRNGSLQHIRARKAVILACGGFEADEAMQRQLWQEKPVLLAAYKGNTGDGIRMAQDMGAGLWHMWHYHGTYGFKHPDPDDYPYGIRLKRLPDWIPGTPPRDDVRMPWILVDRAGRRYMNEYPPYMQDTGHRPMEEFDPATQSYLRNPSFLIIDEPGRLTYPLCSPTFNDRSISFDWSEDTLRALELRILSRADCLDELADNMGVDYTVLRDTVDRWNASVREGTDRDYHRPQPSMCPIAEPPFYFAQVWPICSNTHGGPVHNADQQVMNVYGQAIPRLYAAGELGGVFGHLYMSGGNLAECFVGGWTAGRHAAALDRV